MPIMICHDTCGKQPPRSSRVAPATGGRRGRPRSRGRVPRLARRPRRAIEEAMETANLADLNPAQRAAATFGVAGGGESAAPGPPLLIVAGAVIARAAERHAKELTSARTAAAPRRKPVLAVVR